MKKRYSALACCMVGIMLPQTGFSQTTPHGIAVLDEIVVTATRRQAAIAGLSGSITVIDADELAQSQDTTVLAALRRVPGLDVVQSGGAGATTSVFIRGTNSDHTLVLIDGVKVNSPTLGMFNFANLMVNNIKQIEIVRGAQSTLYGSDAIGGVINIITRKGIGVPRYQLTAESGRFDSKRIAFNTSGSLNIFNYSIGISHFDTNGISRVAVGTEADGYQNNSLSGRFGFTLFKDSKLDFIIRYTDSDTDIDAWKNDSLQYDERQSFIFSTNFRQPLTDKWHHTINLSINDENTQNTDPNTALNNSGIDTRISTINWQHEVFLTNANSFIAGIEWQEQDGVSRSGAPLTTNFDQSIVNRSYYIQHQWNLNEELFLTAGTRLDDHETFGSTINYQTGLAYLVPTAPIKLRGNWTTGFKAPTFNDLFWPNSGNPNLIPEESVSYDLGIDFLSERFHLGATYFHNDIENLIAWTPPAGGGWLWTPKNINEARTRGVELEVSIHPLDNLEVTANYTYTNAENKTTGRVLPRRADNKYSVTVNYQPITKVNLNLNLNYVGDRWHDAANTNKLDSYTLIDLAASYDWHKNFQIFVRGENIFDQEYEEVNNFGTPGTAFYLGIKATL